MADCIGAQLHPQADCIGRGPQQQPTASDANSPPKTITANDFMTNSWVTGILSATRGMREERGNTRFWVVVQGQFDQGQRALWGICKRWVISAFVHDSVQISVRDRSNSQGTEDEKCRQRMWRPNRLGSAYKT